MHPGTQGADAGPGLRRGLHRSGFLPGPADTPGTPGKLTDFAVAWFRQCGEGSQPAELSDADQAVADAEAICPGSGPMIRAMIAQEDALLGRSAATPRQQAEVWVWPENHAAASLWLLVGHSAWDIGWDGSCVSLRLRMLLEFAREFVARDPSLDALALVQDVQVIAGAVAPLRAKVIDEARRREEARQGRRR